ncbi:formylglycine-generating enzyme family protein [Ectothiorhodospiraceae bacterium BW-2]|nr:formylglycine-generating enzyme family protein [Ectothiorhodospiraceae bacterium BW-2]
MRRFGLLVLLSLVPVSLQADEMLRDNVERMNRFIEKVQQPRLERERRERERRERERELLTGKMVRVPGGCFQMGSNSGGSNEKPVHEVCLDSFEIGKYEVTRSQWQAVMGSNPSKFKKGGSHPVEQVSWEDSQQFIRKLNQKTGGNYRLPTEAEWEYACRSGGKNEPYSGSNSVDSVGWHGESWADGHHAIGGKQANGLGIYDMSGNVWEWVQDWYDKNAYNQHSRYNPIYTASASLWVNRGGSWGYDANSLRCAGRSSLWPGDRYGSIGLRLAR